MDPKMIEGVKRLLLAAVRGDDETVQVMTEAAPGPLRPDIAGVLGQLSNMLSFRDAHESDQDFVSQYLPRLGQSRALLLAAGSTQLGATVSEVGLGLLVANGEPDALALYRDEITPAVLAHQAFFLSALAEKMAGIGEKPSEILLDALEILAA